MPCLDVLVVVLDLPSSSVRCSTFSSMLNILCYACISIF